MEPQRRSSDSWHVDKTIDLAHIITTVILVVGGMTYVTNLDKRLAVLENNAKLQDEIRGDIKDIKQVLAPLPSFMARKDETDSRQWDRITKLESNTN